MKVIIYSPSAQKGGALTILDYYKEKFINSSNDYYFLLGTDNFTGAKNIRVINIGFHSHKYLKRIFFYLFKLKRLVKSIKPDLIITFTNTKLFFYKGNQMLYLHQVLPFSQYKISITNEPNLWFRKNVWGIYIRYCVRKSKKIIVQSNHFEQNLVNNYKINREKIIVEKPNILACKQSLSKDPGKRLSKKIVFFYPADYFSYKNHQLIFNALISIEKIFYKYFEVWFTMEERDFDRFLFKNHIQLDAINIVNKGYLKKIDAHEAFKNSIIINVSLLESYGLILSEAVFLNSEIISIDLPYAREVLGNYKKVTWIKDSITLKRAIQSFIDVQDKEVNYN